MNELFSSLAPTSCMVQNVFDYHRGGNFNGIPHFSRAYVHTAEYAPMYGSVYLGLDRSLQKIRTLSPKTMYTTSTQTQACWRSRSNLTIMTPFDNSTDYVHGSWHFVCENVIYELSYTKAFQKLFRK